MRNEDGSLNWGKISTILGILSMLGMATVGTIFYNAAIDKLEDSFVERLQDPHSKISVQLDKDNAKMTKEHMTSVGSMIAISALMENYEGRDQDEMIEFLDSTLSFGSDMKKVFGGIPMSELKKNLTFLTEQRAELEAAASITGNTTEEQMVSCGDIFSYKGVPAFFRDEERVLRTVFLGKPPRGDGKCYKYNVFYFRGKRDMVRVLKDISDVILQKCN